VPSTIRLSIVRAVDADAPALATMRNTIADDLTMRHGRGHWSGHHTERGILPGIRTSQVVVARMRQRIVGTFRLTTKKPWAIDAAYFTPVACPLYLLDMAVEPDLQRRGIGRRLLDEAVTVARRWPADAIRLDAYDAAAGAGDFYAKCGYCEVGRVTYRGVPLVYFELVL
jgi:GNAT superfamily N-acetyltransferase